MERENMQYIIIGMIVMLICLILFCSCGRTQRHAAGSGISVELPHTPVDVQKGGRL